MPVKVGGTEEVRWMDEWMNRWMDGCENASSQPMLLAQTGGIESVLSVELNELLHRAATIP